MASKIEELKLDIQELQSLMKSSKRPKVTSILSIEVRKLETELIRLTEAQKKEKESQDVGAMGDSVKAPAATQCYDVKLSTYAWDQSDKFVKIFVTLKNVQSLDEDKVTCTFDPSSMELFVRELDNRNYFLRIKGFLHEIDDTKSYVKVKNDLVSVFLAKKKQGQNWSHLSATEQKIKDAKKPNLSNDDDPSAGIMNVMRQMYEEGDDEMKRTIAKAWTENQNKI